LLAYGFSQKIAGVLFLASAMPVLVLLVYLLVMSAAAVIIITAVRLERELSIHENSLAVTYAKLHLEPMLSRFGSIETLTDGELLSITQNLSYRLWSRKSIPLILYAAIAAQVILALVSLTIYHYRFM
jgi:hypothetical protein